MLLVGFAVSFVLTVLRVSSSSFHLEPYSGYVHSETFQLSQAACLEKCRSDVTCCAISFILGVQNECHIYRNCEKEQNFDIFSNYANWVVYRNDDSSTTVSSTVGSKTSQTSRAVTTATHPKSNATTPAAISTTITAIKPQVITASSISTTNRTKNTVNTTTTPKLPTTKLPTKPTTKTTSKPTTKTMPTTPKPTSKASPTKPKTTPTTKKPTIKPTTPTTTKKPTVKPTTPTTPKKPTIKPTPKPVPIPADPIFSMFPCNTANKGVIRFAQPNQPLRKVEDPWRWCSVCKTHAAEYNNFLNGGLFADTEYVYAINARGPSREKECDLLVECNLNPPFKMNSLYVNDKKMIGVNYVVRLTWDDKITQWTTKHDGKRNNLPAVITKVECRV